MTATGIERHTFLFGDLVGFTALTAADGDDRGAEVALSFYERVRALLEDHGAEEVKTLGDGVVLRCADHAAAVELGLQIVDELESTAGFPPVRIGLHTGPAVYRGGDWYGTTVNVAARLCAVAGGGEVLVSEATRVAAGRMRTVEFDDGRLHWLRNLTDPVQTFSATRRRRRRFDPARVRAALSCPGGRAYRATTA
jgi:class 3 adenylate cyclase